MIPYQYFKLQLTKNYHKINIKSDNVVIVILMKYRIIKQNYMKFSVKSILT